MVWTELGRRVKDERGRRGMSAEALGRASGMTAQTVANVESGDHCPLVATLSKLAEAMDMRAEDLLVAEPGFVVLGFELPAHRDIGDVASLEDRVKHDVEVLTGVDPLRVAVFPWLMHEAGVAVTTPAPNGRTVWMRVHAASVVEVAAMACRTLLGFPVGPPTLQPLWPVPSLDVLVSATSPESAVAEVRQLAWLAGCCPAVTVVESRPLRDDTGYLCRVDGLTDRDSLELQRLPSPGPDGLFVAL